MMIILPGIVSLQGEPSAKDKAASQPLPCQAGVREVLKQTFKYDPSIRKKAEEEGLLEDDVIRLEPLLVSEKKVNPYLVRQLDHTRELFEAGKPSLSNGVGKAISPVTSVGVMPYDYNFLPSARPVAQWTLLNVRM
ncbi:MAG: hypothetical protein QM715_04600 [Nibricoccus sp.]